MLNDFAGERCKGEHKERGLPQRSARRRFSETVTARRNCDKATHRRSKVL